MRNPLRWTRGGQRNILSSLTGNPEVETPGSVAPVVRTIGAKVLEGIVDQDIQGTKLAPKQR